MKRRPVYANAIARAIEGSRKLKPEDVAALQGIIREAFSEFTIGHACPANWCTLADALNVAESLVELRICHDDESVARILAGQRVLADVHGRHEARGWTLYPAEHGALSDAVWTHGVQLAHCSLSEYERALKITRERIAQARAGNAPRGAVLVEGSL